jgi:hypothetical protein
MDSIADFTTTKVAPNKKEATTRARTAFVSGESLTRLRG